MSIVTTQPDGTSPGEDLTPASSLALTPETTVHFIGIGGSGMSALAQLLRERNINVTGSDLRDSTTCEVLRAMGARIHIGHEPDHIAQANMVVISNAIAKTNPERAFAHAQGIPVVLRADLLNMLMREDTRILISGTHGKTSTTALTAMALQGAHLDPSFAIGGALHSGGSSAHSGTTPVMVAEADEAFRSFLRLQGDCIIITNIEMDHHDVYDDIEAIYVAFSSFVERSSHTGPVIACGDDPGVQALLPRLKAIPGVTVITYGFDKHNTVQITDFETDAEGRSHFKLMSTDPAVVVPDDAYCLFIPGRHNACNATAASIAAAWAADTTKGMVEALNGYRGAIRRFQRLGTTKGMTIVDDYAHHPTEITATIHAARQIAQGRVVVVFQPHRYTRTQSLGVELGLAMEGADIVYVTDVYSAGEEPVPGVSGAIVSDAAARVCNRVHYLPVVDELEDALWKDRQSGDVVVFMGAGDVTQYGPKFLNRLDGRSVRHGQ